MKKIILICLLLCSMAYAQKPVFATANATAATVYFNAAEITQTASVTLPAGTSEIVVKNVADYINESTIQIGAPASLTVLSVQFTRDYISEYDLDESSPEIKKVRDSIKLVEKEWQRVNNAKASETKTLELLDKNNQVYGQQSSLSVAELMKMVEYYKAKRTETANTINALSEREQRLNELLQKLNSRLEINTAKEEKQSQGKLVLQVMNEQAGNIPLSISYLTGNASWSPFYDLRADNTTGPMNMLYKAQVVQNTGVDWKNIKLRLSSGMPNQNNQMPELTPWFVYFQHREILRSLQGQVAGLNIAQGSAQPGADNSIILRGVGTVNGNLEALYVIDGVPANEDEYMTLNPNNVESFQILKDSAATSMYGNRGANGVIIITTKKGREKDKASVSEYTQITENQMNVSFDIDIPYDIASNGKRHSVTMKEVQLPATYRHYAAPKIEESAFLMAEITDYSKYNLLRGEANIIFEGMYIGKTVIDPSQTADTLSLSMGRDKKISVEREKVIEKSGTKFLSSRKEQVFTYDITVRNNKKEAVLLSLEDQYPLSTDKEIEVELLESSNAKVNKETGIVEWELNLKPGETKKLRLSYLVKYPKSKNLNNL